MNPYTPSPFFRRRVRAAFTLIELLTVIAIIGILAAILIPVVGRVRASARMVNDTSNLREIGKAAMLFASDHRNAMPYYMQGTSLLAGEMIISGGAPRASTVYEAVDRYFPTRSGYNSNSIYNWQQRPVWFAQNAEIPDGQTGVNNPYGNYAQFSFNPNIWDKTNWRAQLNAVPSPSRTVLMGETNDPIGVGDSDLDPSATPATTGDVATKYRVSQPGGNALYLFCDGHVTALAGNQGYTVNRTIWRWW